MQKIPSLDTSKDMVGQKRVELKSSQLRWGKKSGFHLNCRWVEDSSVITVVVCPADNLPLCVYSKARKAQNPLSGKQSYERQWRKVELVSCNKMEKGKKGETKKSLNVLLCIICCCYNCGVTGSWSHLVPMFFPFWCAVEPGKLIFSMLKYLLIFSF